MPPLTSAEQKAGATVSLSYCAEQLLLPDTSLKEAAFLLVDVLPDPGGEDAALERRGDRKALRGSGCADGQSVKQPRLRRLIYPHPGSNVGRGRLWYTGLPQAESWQHGGREEPLQSVLRVLAHSLHCISDVRAELQPSRLLKPD